MHIKEQNKDQTIFIKYNNWQSKEKTHMWAPHQNPIYLAWINITNSIILELWKIHSSLFKIKRNRKNILKLMKVFAWKKKATSLLKTGFLVTPNLKERWKVVILKKYLKTEVELKLFERKLEFWNLFEDWSLENYL